MDKIAALTPLVVMGVAFCAVAVAVYRFARRESAAEEREDAQAREDAEEREDAEARAARPEDAPPPGEGGGGLDR